MISQHHLAVDRLKNSVETEHETLWVVVILQQLNNRDIDWAFLLAFQEVVS